MLNAWQCVHLAKAMLINIKDHTMTRQERNVEVHQNIDRDINTSLVKLNSRFHI